MTLASPSAAGAPILSGENLSASSTQTSGSPPADIPVRADPTCTGPHKHCTEFWAPWARFATAESYRWRNASTSARRRRFPRRGRGRPSSEPISSISCRNSGGRCRFPTRNLSGKGRAGATSTCMAWLSSACSEPSPENLGEKSVEFGCFRVGNREFRMLPLCSLSFPKLAGAFPSPRSRMILPRCSTAIRAQPNHHTAKK